jgi:hypothetical protein
MDWWHPLTWDWATIWKTAIGAVFGTATVQGFLGAVFGTAAFQGLLSIYRDQRHRKSKAA